MFKLSLPKQANPVEALRARFVQVLVIIGMASAGGGFIAQLYALISGGEGNIFGFLSVIIFFTFNVYVYDLLRHGRLHFAATLIVLVFTISILIVPEHDESFLLGTLSLISAALLADSRLFTSVNIVVFGRFLLYLLERLQETNFAYSAEVSTLSIQISALVIISVTTRIFISAARETALGEQRNADLLRVTSEVGQIATKLLNLDNLLVQVTNLILDRFGYYHAQVFIIDENRQYANLVASTGEVGQQLLRRNHRLAVGSQSVIGRVSQLGEPVIASSGEGGVHAVNELLPNTRSELAVPIFDGDVIIGALDVQSERLKAFDPASVQTLQTLANQLGIAIRNARLFEMQEKNVQENKRLFLESEINLREIQRLNQQLTRQAWDQHLTTSGEKASGVMVDAQEITSSAEWTSRMIQAGLQQRPVRETEDGDQVIAVPIILRGETIGAVEIEVHADLNLEDIVDVVQAVAQRLAISLDNARLFEEAQEATLQEQRINTIASRYEAANSVDELLQITLRELGETLGAEQGKIRLGQISSNGDQSNGVASS